MDELDLLARVREDVPELDPFVGRRVRHRLLQAAEAPAAPPAGRSRRRVPLRIGVAAAAVAAVLATGVVLTGTRSPDGTPIGSSASAAEVLNRAADSALKAAPVPTPGPGQVLYRRETGGQAAGTMGGDVAGSPAHLCASVHEMWMPVDPEADAVLRRTDGIVVRGGTGDPTAMPHDPQCGYGTFTDNVGAATGDKFVGPAELRALPTDPRELYQRVRAQAAGQGSNDDEGTLMRLTDLARSASPYLSPQLTAALYRAIAYVPGIELVGPGRDMLGRAGTVVGRTEPARGTRQELIFDPASGRMLGQRETVIEPGTAFAGDEPRLARGAVLWQSVITVSVVDRVWQRPVG